MEPVYKLGDTGEFDWTDSPLESGSYCVSSYPIWVRNGTQYQGQMDLIHAVFSCLDDLYNDDWWGHDSFCCINKCCILMVTSCICNKCYFTYHYLQNL